MESSKESFFDFINRHTSDDLIKLRLSCREAIYNFDIDFAILQIEARRKYRNKLKTILDSPEFVFPDAVSAEQASHQAVAKFHADLIGEESHVLDMTAGLGIDSIYLSQLASSVVAIEMNPLKAQTLDDNAGVLGIKNLKVINDDSINFLKESPQRFDSIFIDPSRRDATKGRVYNLRDCSPNVIEHQDLLLSKSNRIFIKSSPLLDISQTLKDFKKIKAIRAIGVKGECKEILIELDAHISDFSDSVTCQAVDLDIEGNVTSLFEEQWRADAPLLNLSILYASLEDLKPGSYILEPSAMMMKLGKWESICKRFNAKKFDNSSHIFISQIQPANFPGRVTRLEKVIKKQDRKSLSGNPVSVVSRNYPLSVDEIRKSLHLKEGDHSFLYATRLAHKPIMLLTSKL